MCVHQEQRWGISLGGTSAASPQPWQIFPFRWRNEKGARSLVMHVVARRGGQPVSATQREREARKREGSDRIKMERGGRGIHLESCHIDRQEKCLRSLSSHLDGPWRGNFATRYWLTLTDHDITFGQRHSAWVIEVQTVLSLCVARVRGAPLPNMPAFVHCVPVAFSEMKLIIL